MWWAIDGDAVREVLCFSCVPKSHDYWFCPLLKMSLQVNREIFETEAEALDVLMAQIARRYFDMEDLYAELKNRRDKL